MTYRLPYSPSRDLITETVRVGLPLDTKRALTDAARRSDKTISAVVREAIETAIERDITPAASKTGAER